MFSTTQRPSLFKSLSATSTTPPTFAWRAFAAVLAIVCLSTSSFLMTDPAIAQALAPVVRSATIIRDTVVAVALLVMTAAIGIAGFRVAFSGASFRDVSNLVIGGALAGGAAAIAAIFVA
jgi:type IV secretion system protein VirB2